MKSLIRISFFLWIVSFINYPYILKAETNILKKDAILRQSLIPLKKTTVGPSDSFDSHYIKPLNAIVLTKTRNLDPHLYLHYLETGKEIRLRGEHGDTKNSAVSPNGEFIAYVSFLENSNGDICYYHLKDREQTCLGLKKFKGHSPFWVSDKTLAFIKGKFDQKKSSIIFYDIKNKTSKEILSGEIWAAAVTPDSKYLVYNGNRNSYSPTSFYLTRVENIKKQTIPIRVSLPGVSGLPSISPDGIYLYFTHFLNDTNKDDSIDADDHGVIFRLKIEDIVRSRGRSMLPEQLTSVRQNCSFPDPTRDALFITCAYQGSLDIYQLPLEGRVPYSWQLTQLESAYKVSRRYRERILLLNTMLYRFGHKFSSKAKVELYRKLLSNHIQIDEFASSLYYVDKILHFGDQLKLGPYLELVKHYIKLKRASLKLPRGLVTTEFKKTAMGTRSLIQKSKGPQRLKNALMAFSYLYTDPVKARAIFKKIAPTKNGHSMVIYLAHLVGKELLNKKKITPIYFALKMSALIQDESDSQVVYYYLRSILRTIDQGKLKRKTKEKFISSLAKRFSWKIGLALLKAEPLTDQLCRTSELRKGMKILYQFNDILHANLSNYHAKMALVLRTYRKLHDCQKVVYMEAVALNWLSMTERKDFEFQYARSQMISDALETGHGQMAKGDVRSATTTFFKAVITVDDLESHYNYVLAEIKKGQLKELEKIYSGLKKDKKIGPNYVFVQTLKSLVLLDKTQLSLEGYRDKLTEFFEALEDMPFTPQDSAIRYLLMGYLQMEMAMTEKEWANRKQWVDQAHRYLMLAFDLGRFNPRIKISALENLGLLHLYAKNYALSFRFFEERESLKAHTPMSILSYRWNFARSAYFVGDYKKAFELAESSLKLIDKNSKDLNKFRPPFLERAAFYGLLHEKFKAAERYYKQLSGYKMSEANQFKTSLWWGLSLAKQKQHTKAIQHYSKALNLANHLLTQAKEDKGKALYTKSKSSLLGLMAQSEDHPAKRIQYLKERVKLLTKMVDSPRIYFLKPEFINSAILYARAGIAKSAMKKNDGKLALNSMNKAIELALEMLNDNVDLAVNSNMLNLASDYLRLGILVNAAPTEEDETAKLNEFFNLLNKGLGQAKSKSSFVEAQKLHIDILSFGYNYKFPKVIKAESREALMTRAKKLNTVLYKKFIQPVRPLLR